MTIKYTKDHEWLSLNGDIATIGITAFAAEQLGDVVYVEVPEIGKTIEKGVAFAVVESVKAASDVYTPISGEIIEANDELSSNPQLVNEDAMGQGWFVKLKLANSAELDELMDEAAYNEFLRTKLIGYKMRYLPLENEDRKQMLEKIGVSSINELFEDIPHSARLSDVIDDLPNSQSELAVSRKLSKMAAKNLTASNSPFFCGAGAYKHHIPASVDHIIQRSEFLTSYTPYQPEIAQGTLQSMFEFQTQVARLLDCDVANSSMYDGSTACAEAIIMAHRINKRKKVIISGGIHPHYLETAKTALKHLGLEIIALSPAVDGENAVLGHLDDDVSCVVISCPNVFGTITDLSEISKQSQAKGIVTIGVFTEIMAFGIIEPLGAMGIDIVVGEGQSIGNSLNFGGPYVGLFATREKYLRQMPGRLTGQTVDGNGERGFVLTLSTREQHIRREKATSNICTNSGLCALAFTIHLTLLGEMGLENVANLNHEAAIKTHDALAKIPNVKILNHQFFNEFAVLLPKDAGIIVEELAKKGILGGVPYSRLNPNCDDNMKKVLLVAATECTQDDDIEIFAKTLKEIL